MMSEAEIVSPRGETCIEIIKPIILFICALLFSFFLPMTALATPSVEGVATYLPDNHILVTVENSTDHVGSGDIDITYKDGSKKKKKTYYADVISSGTSYLAIPYSGKKKPKKLKVSVTAKEKESDTGSLDDVRLTVLENNPPRQAGLCRQIWIRLDNMGKNTVKTSAVLLFYSGNKLAGAKSIYVYIEPDNEDETDIGAETSMFLTVAPFIYADREEIAELEDKYPIDRVEIVQGMW